MTAALARDRQAHPRPERPPVTALLRGDPGIEDPLAIVGAHARTVVLDVDAYGVACPLQVRLYPDLSAGRAVRENDCVKGVLQEAMQDLT